jgi:hypothetical protein
MTIHSREELKEKRPQIDLSGPQGNAFCLMGLAKKYAKDLGKDGEAIQKRMQSGGNYESLVKVFEEEFGEYVDLYR